MLKLTKVQIDGLAQGGSISNAKSQVNKFVKLSISPDQTVVFGHCQGSGKNPYVCSYDFIDEATPIARCSCPSRQIPCKHALALLYAYEAGKSFATEEIPEDILSKREKIAKRAETKEKKLETIKERPKNNAPTPAKINAAKKRIQTQLEGLTNAGTLVRNILQSGIAGIDSTAYKNLATQAKNLGNYYINGIETAFNKVLISLKNKGDEGFDEAITALIYFGTLVDKAQAFLKGKLEGDEQDILKLDTTTDINELIGHIWTTESLYENEMVKENATITQLAFYSYDDQARKEFIERGLFCCLEDGQIYQTINYRPYKATKYIKADDTIFDTLSVDKLFIYPKNINPRIKYDKATLVPTSPQVLAKISAHAKTNYAEVVKSTKGILINPLSNRIVVHLLRVEDIITTEAGTHIEDKNGNKIILTDSCPDINISTLPLFQEIAPALIKGQCLLVAMSIDADVLGAKPLSIVAEQKIVRLCF